MITASVWKQTKDPAKCMWKPIQSPHKNKWEQGETFPHDSGSLAHSLRAEQTASESRGNVTYPVEKDEGDALSEVWAHEPLKGLFVPLLAWIITLRSPVMCRRWYMRPHLLLLGFHLLPKPPINKKTRAANGIAAYPTTAGSDPSLRLRDLFGENWSQVHICLERVMKSPFGSCCQTQGHQLC